MKQIIKLLKETITTVDEAHRNNALAQLWHAFILVDDEVTPNCAFHAALDALDEAEQFINCMSFYESSEEDDESPQDNIHQQIRETIFLLREKAAE